MMLVHVWRAHYWQYEPKPLQIFYFFNIIVFQKFKCYNRSNNPFKCYFTSGDLRACFLIYMWRRI
jgi:uncharacterized membrane protein